MKEAHTGEHILFRALSIVFEGMTVKKVELGERTYFLVHYDKEFDWNSILEAECLANKIISEGRPVKKIQCSRKEAEELYPQLRVRWDRITDDTVTVVEVEGFDWAACVGEHVVNTAEIKYILVTRIASVGKNDYEIEFVVGESAHEEALKRSVLAMGVSALLGTSLDKVLPTIQNLKEAKKGLTEAVQLLTKNVVNRLIPENINGISVYIEDVTGADRNLLQKTAAHFTSTGKTLVIFLDHTQNTVILSRSPLLPVDCRELFTVILPEGKGGGKPDSVLGKSTKEIAITDIKMRTRQFLEKRAQI
jgi:alanyl-tRNA synthetase